MVRYKRGRALRPLFLSLAALSAVPAFAQPDVVTLTSPDGQLRFRLYTSYPNGDTSQYWKLTYDVTYRGKPLINPSYMQFAIKDQDVLLGEKLGLTALSPVKNVEGRYNTLIAQYLQSGSLGRRLTVEARAYNDALAFRYYIPRTGPLEDLYIEDEETDFNFAEDARMLGSRISLMPRDKLAALPLQVELSGLHLEIMEAQVQNYAGMKLFHPEGTLMRTTLPPRLDDPYLAISGTTPIELPWRVLLIGMGHQDVVNELNPPSPMKDTSWIKPAREYVSVAASANLEDEFLRLQKSGATGVKIDLMNREDQQIVEVYRRAAKLAAEHRLMVQFVNCPIHDGIERTWPNVIQPAVD